MAKTKTGRTTKGSRQPQPKHLGIKVYGGQKAKAGSIILKQRGSERHAGEHVGMGRDYTLFALKKGVVKFYERNGKQFVSVIASS